MPKLTSSPIRWGIVGPGGIAQKFARDLRVSDGGELRAVAGRDRLRAQDFAGRFGGELVFDDIRALAEEPTVDIVYVATPHSHHAGVVEILLGNGKPVLCEKPLTVNAGEARHLIGLARENGIFFMEAMWTRCLPVYRQVRRWLDEGRIGRCRSVDSSFCVRGNQDPDKRWLNPALAGGGLLDLGVYNLAVTQLAIPSIPTEIQALAGMSATGVDEWLSVALAYPEGAFARFACGFVAAGTNSLTIAGERGTIRIPEPFLSAQRAVCASDGEELAFEGLFLGDGFEFEINEAMRCLRAGEVESPMIPLDDTLATQQTMDRIREQIGLRYPFESGSPSSGGS